MAVKYEKLGRERTFVTDLTAIEDVIGPLHRPRTRITAASARDLEIALGLERNSLERINVLSVVYDVAARAPASPIRGNRLFLGGGLGLPGGGPELTIAPIPSAGGYGVDQVILEVGR